VQTLATIEAARNELQGISVEYPRPS
jgi:hypothetical protein